MRGLSLVVASGGHSSSRCTSLSLWQPLLLQSTGSRRAGSVIVAHGPSCSAACGIFPDQGSNPCPLHWQADSQPLRHQGSPTIVIFSLLALPTPSLANGHSASNSVPKKLTPDHSLTCLKPLLVYTAFRRVLSAPHLTLKTFPGRVPHGRTGSLGTPGSPDPFLTAPTRKLQGQAM